MRILLVEDDEFLTDILLKSLASYRYVVDTVTDGASGWNCAQGTKYDLILLDIGLPKLDGITLCQRLRADGCKTPILLMTARNEKLDRIRGLDAGADDYLLKPLDLDELQARIRALFRRGETPIAATVLEIDFLRLDPGSCQVTYADKPLKLTPKEYNLLELFMRNPLRVFSRGQIVEHLWTFDDPPLEDSVKGHVKTLRNKLKVASKIDWIENVYGIGYRFTTETTPKSTAPVAAVTEFDKGLAQLWERHQGLMLQRLAILQQTVLALQNSTLTSSLQAEAKHAVHKLAGVLGMFDRDDGTQLSRQIETILRQDASIVATQAKQFANLVRQLEQSLNLQPASNSQDAIALTVSSSLDRAKSIHILVVDDDPLFLDALATMLSPWDIHVTGLEDSRQFWDVLNSNNPDLLILDVDMPHRNGIELCQSVRNDLTWQDLPILFITARQDRSTIQQIFTAGADDYITKPVVGEELLTRITNRLERNRLMKKLATTDSATGLTDRIHSSRLLNTWIQQAQPFCLMVFSIEELAAIDLQYGHEVGNRVLQQWGQLFRSQFPAADLLGYWGNGDFIIALLNVSKEEMRDRSSDLEQMLRQQIFTADNGVGVDSPLETRFQTLFQSGVAVYPIDGETLQLLYQAVKGKFG